MRREGPFPRSAAAVILAVAMIGPLVACGDDPFQFDWNENTREARIYSLSRDEMNRPTAFEMAQGIGIIIESVDAAGQWDFALDTQDGQLVFVPPRVLGVQSNAAIVPYPNTRFDEVREAPSDTTLYVMDEVVPVVMGTLYVIRTREQSGFFGEVCTFYGKVQPLEPDPVDGTLLFRFDASPDCNNPRLVPPRG